MDEKLEFDEEFRNEIKFQKKYFFLVVAISGFFITVFTCVGCFIQCAIMAENRFFDLSSSTPEPLVDPRPLPTTGYSMLTTTESGNFLGLANNRKDSFEINV